MKQNKLGAYLSTFSDEDWSAFHKFSKSSFSFNSDFQSIITYIKKHKSRFDFSNIDTEYLRKKIRPEASKQVFANAISNLCKHIERYLIWAEVESDPMMKDSLLLQAVAKRGLNDQFHKLKQKSKISRDKMPLGLWNNYYDFRAEYLQYYCNMSSDIKSTREVLKNSYLYFQEFQLEIINYLGVEMHNRTTLLNEDWTDYPFAIINNEIPKSKISTIFRNLKILKEKREQSSFQYLKGELFNEDLSDELLYTILIHLTSFINGQIVRGKIRDSSEILELYQYGLEKDILYPSGSIPLLRYINIINVACGVKDFQWAFWFVDKYSKNVGTVEENEIKLLGQAQIEFAKSNFDLVIQLLNNTKFKFFEVEARARWFLLSAIYELNQDDTILIDYYVQALINFVKRNKLKTTKLTTLAFQNNAKYVSKISKGKKLDSVLESIKQDKTIYYRRWLIAKTNEKLNPKKIGR